MKLNWVFKLKKKLIVFPIIVIFLMFHFLVHDLFFNFFLKGERTDSKIVANIIYMLGFLHQPLCTIHIIIIIIITIIIYIYVYMYIL
jgi:hypothetical protein